MKKSVKNVTSILVNDEYSVNKNIISFINDDSERPYWSKAVDNYCKNKILRMGSMYNFHKNKYANNKVMQEYFEFITYTNRVIIDLASGPSGYFGPALEMLKDESFFIITDASPSIIHAHSVANKKNSNVLIFDIDLDKPLPIKDNSIDVYCGNLVDNVDGYKSLLKEVYRTLKIGGKAAFIEIFFEKGTKTHEYLLEKEKLISSLDYYLNYCKSLGFKVLKTELEKIDEGKPENDLLPIDEKDKKYFHVIYLAK